MGYVRALLAGPIAAALLAAAGIYYVIRVRRQEAPFNLPEERAIAAPSATPMVLFRRAAAACRNPRCTARDPAILLKDVERVAEAAAQLAAARDAVSVKWRFAVADEIEKRALPFSGDGGIRRRAHDVAREPIIRVARWRSSERARQIAWDVIDACAGFYLGDLPRSSIISRALYSTLTREAKNWWQHPQQQVSPPAAAQQGKGRAAPPQQDAAALRRGDGDVVEEPKWLEAEMDELRAEVRELRDQVRQVRAQIDELKLQEELLGGIAAAPFHMTGPHNRRLQSGNRFPTEMSIWVSVGDLNKVSRRFR